MCEGRERVSDVSGWWFEIRVGVGIDESTTRWSILCELDFM